MDFSAMETAELIERRSAIGEECNTASGDALDALETELDGINAELETRRAAENKRQNIRAAVAAGAGEVVAEIKEERNENVMTVDEIRSSKAYVDAYANYIKTGDPKECRTLLTSNVTNPPELSSGPLPVPTVIEGYIRTAWESDPIMSRVRRTFVRGNLRVAFELSATGAQIHAEGAEAPAEEILTLGVVELIPETIKKWIRISDEAVGMGGEEFLRYIYDEITYQIVKKAAALGINDILNAPATSNATWVGVPVVNGDPSVTLIPEAVAHLSSDARNLVVIMNRLTEVAFLQAQAAGNFSVDPFAGLPRLYTNELPAYSASLDPEEVYAIVGDLDGLQFNYPNGDDVAIKWDELSLAELDLVKIVGRQYAAHGVTGLGRFVKIATKADEGAH